MNSFITHAFIHSFTIASGSSEQMLCFLNVLDLHQDVRLKSSLKQQQHADVVINGINIFR